MKLQPFPPPFDPVWSFYRCSHCGRVVVSVTTSRGRRPVNIACKGIPGTPALPGGTECDGKLQVNATGEPWHWPPFARTNPILEWYRPGPITLRKIKKEAPSLYTHITQAEGLIFRAPVESTPRWNPMWGSTVEELREIAATPFEAARPWRQEFSPADVPVADPLSGAEERIRYAKTLVKQIYEANGVGGNCHIVLDDTNIEDHHIQWTLDVAIPENSHEMSPQLLAVEREVMLLFASLTEPQRAAVLDKEWPLTPCVGDEL